VIQLDDTSISVKTVSQRRLLDDGIASDENQYAEAIIISLTLLIGFTMAFEVGKEMILEVTVLALTSLPFFLTYHP